MPPQPKFNELQKVGPGAGAEDVSWSDGIVVGMLWRETGRGPLAGHPGAPCWVYKVQTGPDDELTDVWWPEGELEAR